VSALNSLSATSNGSAATSGNPRLRGLAGINVTRPNKELILKAIETNLDPEVSALAFDGREDGELWARLLARFRHLRWVRLGFTGYPARLPFDSDTRLPNVGWLELYSFRWEDDALRVVGKVAAEASEVLQDTRGWPGGWSVA